MIEYLKNEYKEFSKNKIIENNREYYFCPVRELNIFLTDKELIRQLFLIKILKNNKAFIIELEYNITDNIYDIVLFENNKLYAFYILKKYKTKRDLTKTKDILFKLKEKYQLNYALYCDELNLITTFKEQSYRKIKYNKYKKEINDNIYFLIFFISLLFLLNIIIIIYIQNYL